MCVCQYIFTSLFRSLLNACHPPSPLLFSVPLLSIRLPRLWTILCPVSMVLAQPALRAARKVMFTPRTQSTFPLPLIPSFLLVCPVWLRWCCARARFNLYNSQLHLSVPLCLSRRCLRCLFIQRLALRLSWTEKQSRSGRISMHPAGLLGRCVFCILAVPASPYFHVGNTNILWVSRFWWCRHIQIDFHTFHFPFLLTFCTFHFSFLHF